MVYYKLFIKASTSSTFNLKKSFKFMKKKIAAAHKIPNIVAKGEATD